jgi:hypothetical protein
MDGDRGRGGYDDIPTLLARLEKYIAPWQNPQNELNRLRCDILNTCFDIVSSDKYSIAVQSLALKILVNYCTIEKELIPELEAYLESMDEYILAPAMLSSKRFALKALSKSR